MAKKKRRAKKKPPAKKANGRPRILFDKDKLDQVFELARIGCTDEEIGTIIGCSADTIGRRKKDSEAFADCLKKGRANRKASLRRKQTELAFGGNVTMLIWLGKQDLDQSDRRDYQHAGAGGGPVKVQVIRIGETEIEF